MQGQYSFFDFEPDLADMESEVLHGLNQQPKFISPKYFYDERGSELFEEITELDEYYVTRTEMALFDSHLPEIAEIVGERTCLVEYGSGSSKKIRKLLEAISPAAYVPIDISLEHLQKNAWTLHQDYPHMNVYPVCADITQPFELPDATAEFTKVGFFPGSSVGNFEPSDALSFMRNVKQTLGEGSSIIIGVDRKKSVDVLERAYNDAQGVTAEFNLNLLQHINNRLDANFEIGRFEHSARYNSDEGCIQMFLRSLDDQNVTVAGKSVQFAATEELHTENSYKYDHEQFVELAASAGIRLVKEWSDSRNWFSLYLLQL